MEPSKTDELESDANAEEIPIPNLPERVLKMQVKSGTKIRNVLGYALAEFSKYSCVVWIATGNGIGKAITCAELFKRSHAGLHQITRLRNVESKSSRTDESGKVRKVPQIFIYLSSEVRDASVPGYQGPNDRGEFVESSEGEGEKSGTKRPAENESERIDASEFASMGLRMGSRKKPRRDKKEFEKKK